MGRPRTVANPGDRYNRLTLVEEVEPEPRTGTMSPRRRFRCRCDCGKETVVRLLNLRGGQTKSCGCLRLIHLRQYRQPPLRSAAS